MRYELRNARSSTWYFHAYTRFISEIGTILNEGFWELDYPSRDFSPNVEIWPYKKGESLRENQSDNCLAEFFGTG